MQEDRADNPKEYVRRYPPVMNLKVYKEFRRDLRVRSTEAEKRLWYRLKNKQVEGRKFRRQHGVGKYVLDFYCPSETLAIELDGPIHDHPNAIAYDRERDAWISKIGIKILRFRNEEVFENMEGMIETIVNSFGPPQPFLSEEGQ